MSIICATPLQFKTFGSKAFSSCFPQQIRDIFKVTKMAAVDERNKIQFGFLWFLRLYENF